MGLVAKFGVFVLALSVYVGFCEWKSHKDANFGNCERLRVGQEEPAWEARRLAVMPQLKSTLKSMAIARAQGKLDDKTGDGVERRIQHP